MGNNTHKDENLKVKRGNSISTSFKSLFVSKKRSDGVPNDEVSPVLSSSSEPDQKVHRATTINLGSTAQRPHSPVYKMYQSHFKLYENGKHVHELKPSEIEKGQPTPRSISGFFKSTKAIDESDSICVSLVPDRLALHRRLSRQFSDDDDEIVNEHAAIGEEQLKLIDKLTEHIDEAEGTSLLKGHSFAETYGKVVGVVGKGAFGVVKVSIRTDGKMFAVKELKRKPKETLEHFSTRLTSEFVVANALHHINIIRTLDLLRDSQKVYLEVMEHCAAGDLYTLIAKTKGEGLPVVEANCFLKQMLRGLYYLHKRGIAHCDIKPENLVLTTEGCLKITDFGTSSVFRTAWEEDVHMCTAGVCGSEPYVSPEEYSAEEYDPRLVDVWASAVVYATMLHGRYLWKVADPKKDELYETYLCTRNTYEFDPIEELRYETFELVKPRKMVLYAMLEPNPKNRLSLRQVLASPWMSRVRVCIDDL